MSGNEINVQTNNGQVLTAEYFKDGQLQIVEVTPFDKGVSESNILSDLNVGGTDETKYLQVLDTGKNLVHLDLLNITLVKCDDDENSYQVVGTSTEENGDTTITCVLSSEDPEDISEENQDSYVVLDTNQGEEPLVYLQSSLEQINTQQALKEQRKEQPLSPTELLKRAKVLQKAKALERPTPAPSRGRKRKELPPPMELLTSPNFKLYLYSCKMCSFKCNAIKDMSAHKAREHGRGARGSRGAALQCARCPYKGTTHTQLMRHVQDEHLNETVVTTSMKFNSAEVQAADVLVCGACGYESGDHALFKRHIEEQHAANTGDC